MNRNKGTTATYEVRIQIPKGSNCHDMQLYIREAILSSKGAFDPDHPMFKLQAEDFIVALRKKETTYA